MRSCLDISDLRSWIMGDEQLTEKDVLMPEPCVHEQEDGTILAIGITGMSTKDSLLSWIRFLQRRNPRLASLPILFSTHSPLGAFHSFHEYFGSVVGTLKMRINFAGQVTPALDSGQSQEPSKITDGSSKS